MSPSLSDSPGNDSVRALQWFDDTLRVLDQRKLPNRIEYETCSNVAAVAEAIASMRVRGAPAIGIGAAYGVVLAARERYRQNVEAWKTLIQQDLAILAASR